MEMKDGAPTEVGKREACTLKELNRNCCVKRMDEVSS